MPRKITIIIEDFDSGETQEGTIAIRDGDRCQPIAVAKAVRVINAELNTKLGSAVEIITND